MARAQGMATTEATTQSAGPHAGAKLPPRLAGGLPVVGHMVQFARDPVSLMRRVRAECGPAGEINLLGKRVVLLSGAEAQEVFCRAPDEQLSQKVAYRLMTPIFGEGVVFDAPLDRLNEQLRILMPALRDRNMRNYAGIFTAEVDAMVRKWGDQGDIDLLDFTAELTTYTSSHCLLGAEFRYGMTEEFARVYAALEGGVNAIAYVNPYLPLPAFRRRDRARARLVEMITANIEQRRAAGAKPDDALQVLMESRYSDGTALTPNEITGILTAAMFAGHHTSSGTAAWTLIELLRNPEWLVRVRDEVDALYARDGGVTYQSLREVPVLESILKEVLRLHPPLIILMRGVLQDLHVAGYAIPAAHLVAISPPVSHAIPELFRDPDRFDPGRYGPGREEDAEQFGWIPFGGGAHRCSGSAFALMQLKAITASLLRSWSFELVDAPGSYQPDYPKMVVQPKHPCRVRYRRRHDVPAAAVARVTTAAASADEAVSIALDRGLCQGHGVCVSEAPELFHLEKGANVVNVLRDEAPPELRAKVELAAKHCPTRALSLRKRGQAPFSRDREKGA
ncbi:MAG TPA: cytochrome P450 [Candidatus Binatia bacterium]|nr:cytochrome P450 [Candidatus Binatia bacterium]